MFSFFSTVLLEIFREPQFCSIFYFLLLDGVLVLPVNTIVYSLCVLIDFLCCFPAAIDILPLCLVREVVKCQNLWYNDPNFKERALLLSTNIAMELIIFEIPAISHN